MSLAKLLGRRIDEPEVEQFMRGLGPENVDDDADEDYDDDDLDYDDDETYRSFSSGGASLLVGSDMLVRAIFLYSQGREGFDAYAGQIDGGITFGDVHDDVIRRLGKPSKRRWRSQRDLWDGPAVHSVRSPGPFAAC